MKVHTGGGSAKSLFYLKYACQYWYDYVIGVNHEGFSYIRGWALKTFYAFEGGGG